MRPDEYRQDPCGASSLPFWKTNSISPPPSMLIVRDDRFNGPGEGYEDTRYFKLIHCLGGLGPSALPEGFSPVSADENAFAEHIFRCYEREGVSADELRGYKNRRVYSPDLWIALAQRDTGEIVATGIGELDASIGEGVLEWIQVSPEYRRRGLGRFLVRELLLRMRGRAEFATVSGRLDSQANPLSLYRSCGFQDGVIWHILQRR